MDRIHFILYVGDQAASTAFYSVSLAEVYHRRALVFARPQSREAE